MSIYIVCVHVLLIDFCSEFICLFCSTRNQFVNIEFVFVTTRRGIICHYLGWYGMLTLRSLWTGNMIDWLVFNTNFSCWTGNRTDTKLNSMSIIFLTNRCICGNVKPNSWTIKNLDKIWHNQEILFRWCVLNRITFCLAFSLKCQINLKRLFLYKDF